MTDKLSDDLMSLAYGKSRNKNASRPKANNRISDDLMSIAYGGDKPKQKSAPKEKDQPILKKIGNKIDSAVNYIENRTMNALDSATEFLTNDEAKARIEQAGKEAQEQLDNMRLYVNNTSGLKWLRNLEAGRPLNAPEFRTPGKQKQGALQKTAANTILLSQQLPTMVPQLLESAVSQGPSIVPQQLKSVANHIFHPAQSIKEGELPNMILDAAMVAGLAHGAKSLRKNSKTISNTESKITQKTIEEPIKKNMPVNNPVVVQSEPTIVKPGINKNTPIGVPAQIPIKSGKSSSVIELKPNEVIPTQNKVTNVAQPVPKPIMNAEPVTAKQSTVKITNNKSATQRVITMVVDNKEVTKTLTPEQTKLWNEAEARYKQDLEYTYKDPVTTYQEKQSRKKAIGMRWAAEKRQISGILTGKEQAAINKRMATNYVGKPIQVEVDGQLVNAIVTGNSYGKVRAKLESGEIISVDPNNVIAVKPVEEPKPVIVPKPVNKPIVQSVQNTSIDAQVKPVVSNEVNNVSIPELLPEPARMPVIESVNLKTVIETPSIAKAIKTPPEPPKPPTMTAVANQKPRYAGNINLDKLNTAEPIRQFITESAQNMELDPEWQARRNTISWEQTIADSKKLGLSIDDVKNIKPGQALSATEQLALRELQIYQAEKLKKIKDEHNTSPSIDSKMDLLNAVSEYNTILQTLQGTTAEAGRTLNAQKIFAQARKAAEVASGDIFTPLKKPADVSSSNYGVNNILFTRQRADAARISLKSKLSRINTGVPIDILPDLIEIGGYHVEAGLREFNTWSRQMVSELGDNVKPYLEEVYNQIKPAAQRRSEGVATQKAMKLKDDAYKKIIDSYGGEKVANSIVEGLSLLPDDNPIQLANFVRNAMKYKTVDKINAYTYANLLSSPTTHIANAISNTAFALQNLIMRAPRALIDMPVSKISGRPREYYIREITPAATGIIQGVPQGFKRFAEIMKSGFDPGEMQSAWDFGPSFEFKNKLLKPLNYIKRGMVAADALAKETAYSSEIYAQATRKAIQEGYKGKQIGERAAELIAKPTEDMINIAQKFAQYSTFQEELGSLSKNIVKLRNTQVWGFQPLRLVLPFVQVATNMLKIGAEYSPAGLAKLAEKGVLRTPEAANIISKSAIGTMGMAALYSLIESGNTDITGAAPRETNDREMFYAEGKIPYAIKVGDKWMPYSRFAPPVAQQLAVIAALRDLSKDNPDLTIDDKIVMNMMGTIKFAADQSYMQGISSIIQAIEDPIKKGEQLAGNILTEFVPLSSALRNATQVTDPYIRDTETVYDRVKSIIPGVSRTLPARVNIYGQEVKRGNRVGFTALWPFSASNESKDPVTLELVRLKIIPSMAGRNISIDGKPTRLNNAQWRAYQKIRGQSIYNAINEYLNTSGYDMLTDEERAEILEDIITTQSKYARDEYKNSLQPY